MGHLRLNRSSVPMIIGLTICLFLFLPVPSTQSYRHCLKERCKGYEFVNVEHHKWYWLGGYHGTIQGYLPMSLHETLKYEEKYRGIFGASLVGLGMVSLLSSIAGYSLVNTYRAKKKQIVVRKPGLNHNLQE